MIKPFLFDYFICKNFKWNIYSTNNESEEQFAIRNAIREMKENYSLVNWSACFEKKVNK